MFNLIVKNSEWADGRDTFPTSRMFEHTEQSLVDKFNPNTHPDIPALTQLPTLLVQETFAQGDQIARVVVILRAHLMGNQIVLEYAPEPGIPPIPNKHLQLFAAELGITDFQFQRTHWSIKKTDIFRAMLKNIQPRHSHPMVFKVADPEVIEPTLVSAMMPFHPNFNKVYKALQKTAEGFGFRCRRADDIWETPSIIQDVVSLIDHSRIVICDCSGKNPNVFYEIGIAHTLGRSSI